MRIHLTGRLTVTNGDSLLVGHNLPGQAVALVLAVLAVEHHRPVSQIELADVIWNGTPPASWRSTLRGHVSRARTALRPLGIDIFGGDGWYQLSLPVGSIIDVIEAEQETHVAEDAARKGDLETAGRAAAIVAMIGAEPILPEIVHPWVDDLRRRMHTNRVRALDVLIALWLDAGHYAQAVVDSERLIALDPLRESGHEGLIRAYIGTEQRALALRAYERCRSVLTEELGSAPRASIEHLYETLLTG